MSRKMTSRHCMMKDSLDMALQEILRYINAIHLTLLHYFYNSVNHHTKNQILIHFSPR